MELMLFLNFCMCVLYSYGVCTSLQQPLNNFLLMRGIICFYLYIKTLDTIIDMYVTRYNPIESE